MSEKKYKFDPEHTFFTSDTHFGHANIIRFCNRPFKNVEEMDEALIENWNQVVSEDDTVFHLGDFAFGGSSVWNSIIPRLNGHINLIIGNHDRKNLRQGYMSYFDMVVPQLQIEIEDNSIYLNHYPFLCYGGSYRGVWQLFGHVHSGPQADGLDISRLRVLLPTQYDVGVDNNNFTPISYREVKEKIESQKNESLDRAVSR
jgi:calcineurin-like phosphoesterase family protein